MSVIEIKNLTKSYGKARGVEDVSLDIKKGEIFGFIGPNGARKIYYYKMHNESNK